MGQHLRAQQYRHAPVRCGRCSVRGHGRACALVLMIAILLSMLLVGGGIVYLLAQRLPKRSREPPRKPANRWLVIGYIGTGQLGTMSCAS